jgi:hypothetical protein
VDEACHSRARPAYLYVVGSKRSVVLILARRDNFTQEFQHHPIKRRRPLQRREVADIRQKLKPAARDTASNVLGMLPLDELIELTQNAPHRNSNLT